MNIQPLFSHIVIELQEAEEVRASGIVLPDTASKERPQQGKVLAVGPDCKAVKKGDIVLFKKYAPTEIKIDNKEYLLLDEKEDVLAIVK